MNNITKLAFVVVSVAIAYAFTYPLFGDISVLMEEKTKQENSLEMVSRIEEKKNQLLAKLNEISADDRKSIETILPNSLNFVKLISQISAIGSKYGINVEKTSSKENGSSAGGSIADAQPQKPFQSAIVGISFSAPYNQFNNFMDELEKSLRILDIRSLKIEPNENGLFSFNVEFETYWLKSD